MVLDLTAALVVALVVFAWRVGRRRSRDGAGTLPSVSDAPPGADPITTPRLNDNGLGTYSLNLPERTKPKA